MPNIKNEAGAVLKIWIRYVLIAFALLLAGVAAMTFFPGLDLTPAKIVSLVVPVVSLAAVSAAYRAGRRSKTETV